MIMHPSSLFTNPYTLEVLSTKKEELVINDPEQLLHWLTENGTFTPEKKKLVLSFYRTRTAENSHVLDILISQGERACRLFFYPCLKQVEPKLYSKIRKYVSEVNESIGDARRQLIGIYLKKIKFSLKIHQGKKDRPGGKSTNRVLRKKGKVIPLSRATKPRKDPAAVDIFAAVAEGSLLELEKTMKDNDLNVLNPSHETLLHVAAAHGQISIMEYLLSKGARTGVKDREGRTALHRAAEKSHGGAVHVLLPGGASMHTLHMEGKTPLHWAAENNHRHILNMLLKEEAGSCRNQHNFLHMAALRDESSLSKMLLEAGACTEEKDERGQTALSYAVSQGFENTAGVLLEAGATVDSNTGEGAIIKILLEYSKALSAGIMESALFRAVQKTLHSVVAALMDRGTDINAHSTMHYPPLLLACEMGKAESAEVLMEKGADLGTRTPAADTALPLAVQAGGSMAGVLLSKGMDTNLRNQAESEETPLQSAALQENGALVGLLATAGARVNGGTRDFVSPLMSPVRGHADAAQQLLQHRAHVNAQDRQAKSPLHLAAEQGHNMAEMLLKARADPNAQDKGKTTPPHAAGLRGHLSTVEVLLVNRERDTDGCTPLHHATVRGNTDMAKVLVASGKNKNTDGRNVWRKTALHIAAECGRGELTKLLLSLGASINTSDSSRDTASAVSALLSCSPRGKENPLALNSLRETALQGELNKTENQAQILALLRKKMLIMKM
ncbi:LOW QUALITY PROTEIN: CARD- and ANK-domain containing inflammasome adapter protein-like [Sylvia borin]